MPLSLQDQQYWKTKLGWRSFLKIATVAAVIGCIVWPLLQFGSTWWSGRVGDFTWSDASDMIAPNFFLALLVSTLIWSIGQLYRYMDWLPPRR